jgi:hypothetical protein
MKEVVTGPSDLDAVAFHPVRQGGRIRQAQQLGGFLLGAAGFL